MTKLILAAGFALISLSAAPAPAHADARAKTKQEAKEELSPAQREEMAAVHEKLAACLRSDKSIEDCHKEMMKSCTGAKGHCPMMMEMSHMHGHMHGKMGKCEHEDEDDKK